MPRQARLDLPGLVCHVMARGIERREIFRDEKDRERFLDRLAELVDLSGTRLYAWALLPNHFHLLLRRDGWPLARFMRCLMTGHAVRFNLRHRRAGHLFQNRYKSIVVEEEEYFLELVRYVHLNPIRTGLVHSAEELERLPWSGHAALTGKREAKWQDLDAVLGRFGTGREEAVERYRHFVAAGWEQGRRPELSGGTAGRGEGEGCRPRETASEGREATDPRILGCGAFVQSVWRAADAVKAPRGRRPWEELLREVARKHGVEAASVLGPSRERAVSKARREFLLRCIEDGGSSPGALSRQLGMHHVSVQRAVAKARGEKAAEKEGM